MGWAKKRPDGDAPGRSRESATGRGLGGAVDLQGGDCEQADIRGGAFSGVGSGGFRTPGEGRCVGALFFRVSESCQGPRGAGSQ